MEISHVQDCQRHLDSGDFDTRVRRWGAQTEFGGSIYWWDQSILESAMIPWYIYAGTAALLILGYVVNWANLLFMVSAMAAAAMIVPTIMGLNTPVWLELLVISAGLCLILAAIAGPPRVSEGDSPDNARATDDGRVPSSPCRAADLGDSGASRRDKG